MSDYSIQVYLQKLTCRDTESIHSSDRFALTGAVTTDQQTTGLMEPTFRINDTRFADVHDYGGRLIFDGMATTPKVALVLQAWDIDNNSEWVENEDTIRKGSMAISTAVKLIPGWGKPVGLAIDVITKVVMEVVAQFIEWDEDDQLMDYSRWWDVPPAGANDKVTRDVNITFSRNDETGYSDWDYTLSLTIACAWSPSFRNVVKVTDDQKAMQMFHLAAELAKRKGFIGGFPDFRVLQVGMSAYGGDVFLYRVQHRTPGLFYPTPDPELVAEWRDVPMAELGNVDLNDFRARFRATSRYAASQGFVGGFPNFLHADNGHGLVCGTTLLHPAAAEYRAVRMTDLGIPPLNDIAERFAAVNDYAVRNGFVGGFPDFNDTEWGNGVVQCGTVLIKPMAGERQDGR